MKGTCVNLNINLDDFCYYQFVILTYDAVLIE